MPDEEPQGPQFKKFPQSRTVDEGSPFKATCALDDVETGKNNKSSYYGSFMCKFVRDCSVDRFVWNISPCLQTPLLKGFNYAYAPQHMILVKSARNQMRAI